jgi:hypothetical protein
MKDQIVKELRNLVKQNTSAIETIESIKQNPNGILINFYSHSNENVLWCLNEIIMLAKQIKLKIKKDSILFGSDANSLLIPNNDL